MLITKNTTGLALTHLAYRKLRILNGWESC